MRKKETKTRDGKKRREGEGERKQIKKYNNN